MRNIKRFNAIKLLSGVFVLASTLLIIGCEIQEDFTYQYDGSTADLEMNAWQFIQQQDSLSLMEEAVSMVGIEELFATSETKTFILPQNVGFRKYLANNGYTSLQDVPLDILEDDLKYHIVDAEVNFQDPDLMEANNPIGYNTSNGEIMYLSHNSNFQGLINEGTQKQWSIITSNLEPTNGVIHITQDVVYLLE